MHFISRIASIAVAAGFAIVIACGGGNDKTMGMGMMDSKLGANTSVPDSCQMCLANSTGNECMAKGKNCTSDMECAKLNTCVNKCANINAACIQNCGDAASQNAIDEWNAWAMCTCGTCASQCNQTFCNIGSGSGSCVMDNNPCSTTQACCTFCASDGNCGCIPSNNQGCQTDHDCCSNFCDQGVCN